MRRAAQRVLLETVGWILVVAGIAALVLPGPGLLMVFAGMAILSQTYDWAERRLEPVKERALRAAEEGVQTWPRIVVSVSVALAVTAVGVVWGLRPPAPGWWPVDESWWLFGGWGTGSTLIVSGIIAMVLVGYSYRRFRVS
jgi:uncharacterized protein (TIGR02611 family)